MTKKAESKIREACLEFKQQGASSKKWKAILHRHEKLVYAEARKLRSHVQSASAVDRLFVDGYFALMGAARDYCGSDADFRAHCRLHIRSAMTDALQANLIFFSSKREPGANAHSEIGRALERFVETHTKPRAEKPQQQKNRRVGPKQNQRKPR